MPEDMPDRMPKDMSDRMPEDLPVRKCINVMVGITRSKVFFLKHVFVPSYSVHPHIPSYIHMIEIVHGMLWSPLV